MKVTPLIPWSQEFSVRASRPLFPGIFEVIPEGAMDALKAPDPLNAG